MKASYEFVFESEAQREALEAALQRLDIPYRVADGGLLAEEPSAEYQAAEPKLLELTKADLDNIRLGQADVEAGRLVPGAKVKAELTGLVDELTGRASNGCNILSALGNNYSQIRI